LLRYGRAAVPALIHTAQVPSFDRRASATRDSRPVRAPGRLRPLLATLALLWILREAIVAGHTPGSADPRSALAAPVDAIRAAVLARDAPSLLRCFDRGQPVFVQMSPLDRGAFLGPGPLDAFITRLIDERTSRSFDVPNLPDVPADASRVFVTAVWTYRTSASSTLQVDHVHLVLSHAAGRARWLIVEIKASSR
jgi:hypothetical protein